tara:strand:+ start:1236 stop:1994 length:759 start_codon:yes stop_codon:yes gene_type:complete
MVLGNGIGVPFTKSGGGGGAGGFAFQRSVSFDGTNDALSTGGTSSSFNCFNQADIGFSCWMKASASTFGNNDQIWGGTDGGAVTTMYFLLSGTNVRITMRTRNRTLAGTYDIAASTQVAWTHYGITVEIVSSTVQRVRWYVNGALVETADVSNNVFTRSNINLTLGSGANTLNGFQCESVFSNYLITDAQMTALYNSGAGADPTTTLDSVHSYYPVSEAAGQSSGTIVDAMGNQNLTMANFVAPYGTNADTP